MADVKIIAPAGMFGREEQEHGITTAMRVIGVGFGEESDWCAKYGCNFENDVFAMRRFYWGDCDCGAADREEEWSAANPHTNGCEPSSENKWRCVCGRDARWPTFSHAPECSLELPNFLYKPTGFALEWYKYIGRDMKVKVNAPLPADFMAKIFASHPKGVTWEQAIEKTALQEEATAASFRKMFADLGIRTEGK